MVKSRSGSGMNNPDHNSESLETIFWVKLLESLDADLGSEMKTTLDTGWKIFGSRIDILDPQHWMQLERIIGLGP
jgi:hypothetical protein